MRGLLIVSLALLGACKDDGSGDTGSSGPTAPGITTSPADQARSNVDVSVVIETESEGSGEISYTYSWLSDAGVEWPEDVLAATATSKGDEWTVTVTPSAGGSNGTSAQATVSIVNTPPAVTSAEFIPSVPTVGTDLSCIPVGGVDEDGDNVTFSYTWAVDGSVLTETTNTLAGSEVVSGVTIECALTPNDGEEDGNTVTVSGAATNAPPTATGSTLAPTAIISTEDLTCGGVGGSDPDGDTVTFVYEWTVNGTVVSETGATLAASNYVRDDVVICTAVPFDGASEGTGVPSASLTVGNAPPTVSLAQIGPTGPFAADTLSCTPTGADPDNGTLTWTYEWTVNGTVLTSETSDFLAPGNFVYDDTVVCTATLTDDGGLSASATSFGLYIENTLPTVTGVAIAPGTATANTQLTCSYGATNDADGQTVGVTYAWTVAGSPAGTGATLASGSATSGQTVVCTVTPNDTVADGIPGTASITMQNAAPPTPTVAISPEPATAASTLSCAASPSTDADGQTITYSYAWFDGSTPLGTGATLSSGLVVRGDTVRCEAIGNDTVVDGPMGSDSLTISNTPPTLASATLSPAAATPSTTFGCTPGSSDDLDGDTVTYGYRWTRGSTTITGATGNSLPSGNFSGGDVIRCHVTPTDTYNPGQEVSSNAVTVTGTNSPPNAFTSTVTPNNPQAQADDLLCGGSAVDPDGDTLTYTTTWEFENYAGTTVAWTTGVENSGATRRTNDAVNAADTVAGRRFRCQLTADDGNGGVTASSYSAWKSVAVPPGCSRVYDGTNQKAGPYLAYGACWYAGRNNTGCDAVCNAAGEDNIGTEVRNAWADTCSGGPTASDPSRWFVEHGNPGASNPTDGRSYQDAGLGYNWQNVDFAGKCLTTIPSRAGSFPGNPSSYSGAASMCACGTSTVSPTENHTGTAVSGYSTGNYKGVIVRPTAETWVEGMGAWLNVADTGSCTVDWYIHRNTTNTATGPWTNVRSGSLPVSSSGFVYYEVPATEVLRTGSTYAYTFASQCVMNHYYESQVIGTAIGPVTFEGICWGNNNYAGYAAGWTPPNCSNNGTAWRQSWKFSP